MWPFLSATEDKRIFLPVCICNVMDLQCNRKDPVTLPKNSNELLLDFFKVTFKNDSQWERAHTGSQ